MHESAVLRESSVSDQDGSSGAGASRPAISAVPGRLTAGFGVTSDGFKEALTDAENLISYAADMGIEIDGAVRRQVLDARSALASGAWNEDRSAALLSALTTLSAKLKPVSGFSLRKCIEEKEVSTLKTYRLIAMVLAVIIVPFSVLAFIASATCQAIRKDIETANALAVILVPEFSRAAPGATAPAPPDPTHNADVLRSLQQFAVTNRAIYTRARKLKHFAVYGIADPLGEKSEEALRATFDPVIGTPIAEEAISKVQLYQGVRYFAQSVQEAVSTSFGAATTCILPMLYALLGACAFLLRSFESQIRARTFTGVERATARFLIAVIGGLVVGLFGDFGSEAGHALPPLAIAFLVGYAVDVFFYFLDGLLKSFASARAEAAPAKP
jgi:hypothetical protein